MELIYADHNRLALGQLSSFDIDFDATEEKNFELFLKVHVFNVIGISLEGNDDGFANRACRVIY